MSADPFSSFPAMHTSAAQHSALVLIVCYATHIAAVRVLCDCQCVRDLHTAHDPEVTPYKSKYAARVILVPSHHSPLHSCKGVEPDIISHFHAACAYSCMSVCWIHCHRKMRSPLSSAMQPTPLSPLPQRPPRRLPPLLPLLCPSCLLASITGSASTTWRLKSCQLANDTCSPR